MSTLLEVRREHRRLSVLRHLEGSSAYTSNISILVDVANGVGIPTTRDQMAGDIAWLAEQGLVVVEGDDEFMVVRATQSGVDVALGRSFYRGVKRPSAGR